MLRCVPAFLDSRSDIVRADPLARGSTAQTEDRGAARAIVSRNVARQTLTAFKPSCPALWSPGTGLAYGLSAGEADLDARPASVKGGAAGFFAMRRASRRGGPGQAR